ncbi:TRAP transporter small permease [Paracoccus zhejiangensis]|uniref:TRAP transporter small permease protein n=1 Tax=Paracoccus zhejiangensis TaxID=1077935 RepID=A0A2H5EZV8_9RHOB|nr:TRAP transporter small permease [Paracoccus zhejiangensis]AUH64820.1 hypothetical protein CX676_12105 [Paracoccus zhejiangensis]
MQRLDKMVRLFAVLGVAAYSAAALITVADILGRRFGAPIIGVVDIVQLCVFTGAWLVMPFAFLTGAHVGVDVIVGAVPRPVALVLRGFATLVTLGLLALLLWHGFATFKTRTAFGDVSQQLGIPIAWFWYPLLAGMAISLIGAALHFAGILRDDQPTEPAAHV